MTTNRDRDARRVAPIAAASLAAGPRGLPVRLSQRACLIGLAGPGVTRRELLHGLPVAVGPYPGLRSACTVTPYREERCLLMPRYAQPGRS